MGANKLDIEFEDDGEIEARKKAELKKSQAVEDIEIDFSAHSGETGVDSAVPSSGQKPPANEKVKKDPDKKQTPPGPPIDQGVLNIQEGPVQSEGRSESSTSSGEKYRLGDELKRISANNRLLIAEVEARVQVETQKGLTDFVARKAQEAKVLETKINRLISQVAVKAPSVKKELMMMKRLLAENARVGQPEEKEVSSGSSTSPSITTQKKGLKKNGKKAA